MNILIAGAGIAGLTVAGLLAQAGARVRVFERSAHLQEVGAGIQISANAGHVLGALGLSRALEQVGTVPDEWHMRLHTGELVAKLDLGAPHLAQHGAPYLTVHRAALQALLIERLEVLTPGALNRARPVASCRTEGNDAILTLSDGTEITGDVIIAADGVKSTLRAQIIGPDQPVYSGSSAWRGLVPADRVPDGLCAHGLNLFMGQGRHMVLYRVRDANGAEYLNYVAPVDQPQPNEESWTTRHDWRELKRDFESWHDEVQAAIDGTDRDACYLWALNIRKPLSNWTRGRATLIGDAAHPTLPFIAQGAAMAIEDAAVLTRALTECADIADALAAYQTARIPRTSRIVEAADTIAETFHAKTDRDIRADLQSGMSSLHDRDTWLYNYNPMTAPLPAAIH